MKKIISIVLIVALCLNSTGVAIFAQSNNQGIENDLGKKEESVEESTEDLLGKEESLNNESETKKELDEVEAEEEKTESTEKEEDEAETDESTEKVDDEIEEKEDETGTEESTEKPDDEIEEKEDEVENEESEIETEEESKASEKSEESETTETLNNEETSKSDGEVEVASPSGLKGFKEMEDDLYGNDYSQANFTVYLDITRTIDGTELPAALFSKLKNYNYDRIPIIQTYTIDGQFENQGYDMSYDLYVRPSHIRSSTVIGWKVGSIETYFYNWESESIDNVIPIETNDNEVLYYVNSFNRAGVSYGDNIELSNEYSFISVNPDHFTKVGNRQYELTIYPTSYNSLLLQSITFRYVDPDTGDDLGQYTDSLTNYYSSSYGGFNNFNNYGYNNDYSHTDFIVYTGNDNNGYIYKTWEDNNFDSAINYTKTRKMHKGYKAGGYGYDSTLDYDEDHGNPYTYTYKIIPEQSDIIELPLSEYEQQMADTYDNFVPRAQVTKRNPTLTFGVYKTATVKYYNNDGTMQITENVLTAQNTQVTNGKWPNSFPLPGVQYIPGFHVTGWNRLPGQDKDSDETESLRGQVITDEDAKNGINLYAVGDIPETFSVVYNVNTPSNVSPSWRVEYYEQKQLYVYDGNNKVYNMLANPPSPTEMVTLIKTARILDVDGNVVLKLKEDEEYIGEDGNKYSERSEYRTGLTTIEAWRDTFGSDNILDIKFNWGSPESTRINYKFKLKDTPANSNSYLGYSSGYNSDSINILDDVSDMLANDYIVNLYKTKNSDYNTGLAPYITYEVDKIEYPENTFENNLIIRKEAQVTVYLAKKVRFTYYDSKGNDITATISSLAAKDNQSYIENDYGLYPVNPLSISTNQALGAIVPNKKVTGWRTSLTTNTQFNSFNQQYQINNRSGNRVSTYYGDKLYTIEKGSYTVKFETVASMSYTWPSNIDKSIQENIETGNSFTMPTVNATPDNKYYHDGWTLNDTPITINSATINASMEALVNSNNELVFKPVIKLLSSTGTLRLEYDSTKGTVTGYTEFINKANYDSKKSSVTITATGNNEFKYWQLKGTSNKYNTVADFDWDGNDATLVAVFKGDSGVSIIVDDTKGTYSGKADYDAVDEFNNDKSTIKDQITPLPTWSFVGFIDGTTSQKYKADLSDFTWDGNDSVELVAEFERIIKNLTFEIDSTKATVDSNAKLAYDTNDIGNIVVPAMIVNTAYEFTRWVKKGTSIEVDPTTWDGVDDLIVVAEFKLLKTLKFDVTSSDIESVTGTTEFNEKSSSITIPTIVCKSGKKIAGWIINGNTGDVKTTAQLQTLIANWDKNSDLVIAPTFANLKTLTFIIPSDKATLANGARLVYDEESTNIQRPSFTTKAGFKFVRWKRGSVDIEDSALMTDINSWNKTSDITYEAVFSNLKTFIFYVDNNYLATPINQSDLEFDEDHLPIIVPTVVPKVGYNKANDNGGWSTKSNGSKSDILSASELQNIIDDFTNKPSDQKQNVKLYYVFVEDDSIPKVKLNYDKSKGTLNGGPDLFTVKSEYDNAKDNIVMNPNSNYTFDGWKDTSTGTIYKTLSEFDWDGTSIVTLDAVFKAKSFPSSNNGGNSSGGRSSGGRSSSGSSSDGNPTTPPAGFVPNDPVNPNVPNNIPPAQSEEERKEKTDNPPANKYLFVDIDNNGKTKSVGSSSNDNDENYYKWETHDNYVWRLMDMRYLQENVHYNNTVEKGVVVSLDKPGTNYYKEGWALIEYKNTREWYHFGKNNIMDIGWYEEDGKFYYLQTVYNKTYGKMLTGENVINGITYVFGKNGVLESIKP